MRKYGINLVALLDSGAVVNFRGTLLLLFHGHVIMDFCKSCMPKVLEFFEVTKTS